MSGVGISERPSWELHGSGVGNLGTLSWASSHLAPTEYPSLKFRIDFWRSVCSTGCGFLVFTDGKWKTSAWPETLPSLSLKSLPLLRGSPLGSGPAAFKITDPSGNVVRVLAPVKHKQAHNLHTLLAPSLALAHSLSIQAWASSLNL